MAVTLVWMQCGACSGDSMSLLDAEAPDVLEAFKLLNIRLLWHPSLSVYRPSEVLALRQRIVSGEQPLDILCVEGAILRGPGGSGMYDTVGGRPKKDLVAAMAKVARFVVAVGTCASFGGMAGAGEVEGTGLQFSQEERGGFLGPDFRTREGLPVVNLAGCPANGDVVVSALSALVTGQAPELDQYQRPVAWYGMLAHQGCTRNEYHEFRVEEADFGGRGCLFFHLGCQGPLSHAPCNKILWNRRSSKTRAGVPCHGCTQPDFPRAHPFFKTREIEGLPLDLPDGVKRAHYMVYKNMARVAAPQRLKDRKTIV